MDPGYVKQELVHLAEDVDQRKTLVTTAMNIGSIEETVVIT